MQLRERQSVKRTKMADHFTELAAPFVLGILEPHEARQFAEHLATGCKACAQEITAAKRVAGLLPYVAPQKPPPPELKQRLLLAIGPNANILPLRPTAEKPAKISPAPATIRAMPSRTIYQRTRGALAWAAVFLLLAVGYGYFLQRGVIHNLQTQLSERRAEIELLQFEMARQQTVIERIKKSKASHLLMVQLKGHEQGDLKIILDPHTAGGSFIASNLPVLSAAHDYQLWFIKDGQPFNAGVFQVTAQGEYLGEIQHLPATLAGITAFAVTREPKGGRPTPTLPIYWIGNVQGV